MARTPLYDRLIAAGAQMAEYCGAETARSFGNSRAEYETLLTGAGVYDLGWRGKIVLTGSDRVRWANGMVTNNIRDLAVGHGNYNFVLSSQGRIQADMYVYNLDDHLMVDAELWQVPKILELFDKYIIMDDVEATNISDKLSALAVQGPKSLDVLRALGLNMDDDVEPLKVEQRVWNGIGISVTRMASDVAQTYEIWAAPENMSKLWDALIANGAKVPALATEARTGHPKPVGTEALEMFRIAAGIPKYGQDISERYIPQETSQDRALHFAKGCYVGQEIVERVRSRGAVHRHLTGLVVSGPPPAPGTEVQVAEKKAGEVTSALRIPVNGNEITVALAFMRDDAGQPGTRVQVNGNEAEVVRPPFRQALHLS